MTDNDIRQLFGLAQDVDLDKPRSLLEFMSYREAAAIYFEKWGPVDVAA